METAGLHLCSFLPSLSRLNKSLHPGFWVGKQEKELFDGKGLEAAVGSMGKRHVKLKLPRFKAEYGIKSLKETMQVGAGWQQEGGREGACVLLSTSQPGHQPGVAFVGRSLSLLSPFRFCLLQTNTTACC